MKRTVMLIVSALALGICTLRAEQEKPAAATPSADNPQTNCVVVLSGAELNERHNKALELRRKRREENFRREREMIVKKLSLPPFPDRVLFPDDFYNQEGIVTSAEVYGSYPEISTNLLLTMLKRYYSKDIDSKEGRERWHGEPEDFIRDSDRQCIVEIYPDGFVYVVPDPPKKPRFTYTNRVYRIQFNRAKTTSERLAVIYDWEREMTDEQLKAELEEVRSRQSSAEMLFDLIDAPQEEFSQIRAERMKWEKQILYRKHRQGSVLNRPRSAKPSTGGLSQLRERRRKMLEQRKLEEQRPTNPKKDTP